MIKQLSTPVGRLRIVGILEGISYLLLLGIAMPLKYLANMPEAVSIVGMAHGVLFICYCLTILLALLNGNISFLRSVQAFISSLLPFGPFFMDRTLANDEKNTRNN